MGGGGYSCSVGPVRGGPKAKRVDSPDASQILFPLKGKGG